MVVTKRTKAANKKKCNACAVEKNIERDFYKIAQTDLNFPDGHVNVCKDCYKEQWEDESTGFQNFLEFLRVANLPYKANLYNIAKHKPDYVRNIRTKAYQNLRHKDSDSFLEEKGEIAIREDKLKELTAEQMQECMLFWGKGYTEEEYLYLMNEYADFNSEYDLSGKAIKTLVVQACLTNLRIRKGLEEGLDVSKDLKSYQELLGSASLKPAQEKAAAENEANTFGTFIKKIENEKPIDAPLPEYADPDNIAKYVRALFTSPMAKSMGLPIPFPEEYEEVMHDLTVEYGEHEEVDHEEETSDGERDG